MAPQAVWSASGGKKGVRTQIWKPPPRLLLNIRTKKLFVARHMTNCLTFVIIDQRIVLYQCKTKTVKSLSELFRCDKCNFHRKKVQISKPDGGRTQAAKSVTGRQKNDRRGPECPYYVERCKCSRSEHVKRSLNQTPSLPRRKCRIFIWPSSVANQWLGGLWWLHYCIISPPLLRFQMHHRHCHWLWTIKWQFRFCLNYLTIMTFQVAISFINSSSKKY